MNDSPVGADRSTSPYPFATAVRLTFARKRKSPKFCSNCYRTAPRVRLTVNDHFENRRFAAILGKQTVHERFRETLACLQRAESTEKGEPCTRFSFFASSREVFFCLLRQKAFFFVFRAKIGQIQVKQGLFRGFTRVSGSRRARFFHFRAKKYVVLFALSNAARTCKKGGRWILIGQSTIELPFGV